MLLLLLLILSLVSGVWSCGRGSTRPALPASSTHQAFSAASSTITTTALTVPPNSTPLTTSTLSITSTPQVNTTPSPPPTLPASTSHVTTPPTSTPSPLPSEVYPRFAQLDASGNYYIYWRANDTHITLEAHVRTRGYIGFGLSPNGGMLNADMVIGWVKDGMAYFKDRTTLGMTDHGEPTVDVSQDWVLVSGWVDDFGTALKFYRRLDTCDVTSDLPIMGSTTRVIYSWGSNSPPDLETGLRYHGATNRGTVSLHLLDPPLPDTPLPASTRTYDIVKNKAHIPAESTYYLCTTHKIPNLSGKHHLIKFEPIVQAGNEVYVHHIILHQCPTAMEDSLVGLSYRCYDRYPDTRLANCFTYVLGWAVGGGPVVYPDQLGYPVGTDDSFNFFVLESHYNNPSRFPGLVDSSGIRVHFTSDLRPIDAGVLLLGITVDSSYHLIPPHYPTFISRGGCSSTFTSQAFQNVPNKEIKIISSLQHGHLLSRGMTTRHFCNGNELPPIAVDNAYDFNFQDYRPLPREVTVKAGDELIVECRYNSTGRTNITRGGFSTTQEMCLASLTYYPRLTMSICISTPRYDGLPLAWMDSADWTDPSVRASFQKQALERSQLFLRVDFDASPPQRAITGYLPVVTGMYDNINSSCADNQTTANTSPSLPSSTAPVATSPSTAAQPVTSETYPRSVLLDPYGKFYLYWRANTTHITFETHVQTRGYFGFGLSPNGDMLNADMVIGWLKDGHVHFTDRTTRGLARHTEPLIDVSQDWSLLQGWATEFGIAFKFYRKLDTCDMNSDWPITESTTRVIYSWGDNSLPAQENGLHYHGPANRGTKSVHLLDELKPTASLPGDTKTYDLTADRFTVPTNDTYYRCAIFKIPNLEVPHHIVGFEPIIQPGHETYVHHIVVQQCSQPMEDTLVGSSYHCYDNYPDARLAACATVIFAWLIGSGPVMYPENVGFPVGTEDSYNFFITETHYNNPAGNTGVVDSSGLRVYYTPTLRQHDLGVLYLGVMVNPDRLLIPPLYPAFISRGGCNADCITQGLQYAPSQEIRVIAAAQHSHLLGRGMTTRHFRNGTELPPIVVDNSYDFNFQDYRVLKEEVIVRAGDVLVVECIYNSTQRRDITVGGLGTASEMCIDFLTYYPRIPLAICASSSNYDNFLPETLLAKLHAADWQDPYTRVAFQGEVLNSSQNFSCLNIKANPPIRRITGFLPEMTLQYNTTTSPCIPVTDSQ